MSGHLGDATRARLEALAEPFLASAPANALAQADFARFAGVSQSLVSLAFTDRWESMRRSAVKVRFEAAIDRVASESLVARHLSYSRIAELVGVSPDIIRRSFRQEVETARSKLPTPNERIEAAIADLAADGVPASQFTWSAVKERAGVAFDEYPTLRAAYRAALAQASVNGPVDDVDVARPVWRVTAHGRPVRLHRDRLREDIAEIAWPFLAEEFARPGIARGTILNHYRGFIGAGEMLKATLDDVRSTTTDALQRSWLAFDRSPGVKADVRQAVVQLLEILVARSLTDPSLDRRELTRAVGWLRATTSPAAEPEGSWLTVEECDRFFEACIADIESGRARVASGVDLLAGSIKRGANDNLSAVADWGLALFLLTSRFTGLRSGSASDVRTGDLAPIGPGAYGLAWRHQKKRPAEEKLAILPEPIAVLVLEYIAVMAPVREAAKTDLVFFAMDIRGRWRPLEVEPSRQISTFAARHNLTRDGKPLCINNQVLRRTFATRAVAEGLSLVVINAQLGHDLLSTTARYARFERADHPRLVRDSLDRYGRTVLDRWHTPLVVDDLEDGERRALFDNRTGHDCGVGLCRHDHCVKAESGAPPPCAGCEHLVTGPEFFGEWEAEIATEHRRLRVLDADGRFGSAASSLAAQIGQFESTFAGLRARFPE